MSKEAATGEACEAGAGRLSRRTMLVHVAHNLLDEPASGFSAWARTTAGVVAFLLALQLITGVLLAFYYVPSTEGAHASLAYVEKVVAGGSWIRALHLYCSQWLTLALVLHLAQMLWSEAYRRKPVGWLAAVSLLALVSANGATGYSLPWDARAYNSTSIAANIAGGLPFAGGIARRWLVGGAELSTLTLSRFYAMHVFVVPVFLLTIVVARLLIFNETDGRQVERTTHDRAQLRMQLTRNAVVIGIVFTALSLYADRVPAPLGPASESAPPGYLPRPGAQFLWLFQLLKYFSTKTASLVAILLPALLLSSLAVLPFLSRPSHRSPGAGKRRRIRVLIFTTASAFLLGLTALAYFEDARDSRVRDQLARQAAQEAEFRRAPFEPRRFDMTPRGATGTHADASPPTADGLSATPPPAAYSQHCARCHGVRGEGRSINPPLTGMTAQPRRTLSDIVAIIDNPASYGLDARMPSFAGKLSLDEKRAVAEWIVALK